MSWPFDAIPEPKRLSSLQQHCFEEQIPRYVRREFIILSPQLLAAETSQIDPSLSFQVGGLRVR